EMSQLMVSRMSVEPQIKYFENTVFGYQGDIHRPNCLIINWGTLVFKCRLENMTINYKLFSPEGLPLRATVTASFIELINQQEMVAKQKSQSPDITHARTVRAGDTLPGLAKTIYGDERYYTLVAQANKIVHFRNLVPGQQILFPPIKKGKDD
ncbi:MAG: LysM peptidoglycan-binding domain-containing protein, partial [Fulvivirga sp.]